MKEWDIIKFQQEVIHTLKKQLTMNEKIMEQEREMLLRTLVINALLEKQNHELAKEVCEVTGQQLPELSESFTHH